MSERLRKYKPDPLDALGVQFEQMRVLMRTAWAIADETDKDPGLTSTLLYMLHEKFSEMDKSMKDYSTQLYVEIKERVAA